MRLNDEPLDVKEILNALSMNSVIDLKVVECTSVLSFLEICEMRSMHIMGSGCKGPL
jgi:hypothetical protein